MQPHLNDHPSPRIEKQLHVAITHKLLLAYEEDPLVGTGIT